MSAYEEDTRAARLTHALRQATATDREDLIAILTMRFGTVPSDVVEHIEACDNLATLERLVLVAANVPSWRVFLAELTSASDSFKVVGERFDPLSSTRAASSHSHVPGRGESGSRPGPHLIQIQRRKET